MGRKVGGRGLFFVGVRKIGFFFFFWRGEGGGGGGRIGFFWEEVTMGGRGVFFVGVRK